MSPYLLLIPLVLSSISLYLLRRRKERGGKKTGGEALESLETQLRDRAETLGLSLEQKTKGMKQRDKKVTYTTEQTWVLSIVYCFRNSLVTLLISTSYIALSLELQI